MTRYAEGTKVPAEKSQVEIQRILKNYGASDVASGEQGRQAVIGFKHNQRFYKIILPYPDIRNFRSKAACEQEIRRLWRVLIIVIKGKLEAVQSGIMTFEQEFMSHMVVNGSGQTMYEWIKPQLESNRSLYLPSPDDL